MLPNTTLLRSATTAHGLNGTAGCNGNWRRRARTRKTICASWTHCGLRRRNTRPCKDAGRRTLGHWRRCVPSWPASVPRSLKNGRSEEHTSELQSLMRISYAVFCLKKKNINNTSLDNYNTKDIQL